MAKRNVKTLVGGAFRDFKTFWNKPRPGEYLSNKEFVTFCSGWAASDSVSAILGHISFTATCFLVGSIYEISFQHIFMIGVLGLPFGYIWGPIGMVTTDNLGRPPKRTARLINLVRAASILAGIVMFFVPQEPFEAIVPGMPRILSVILITSPLSNIYSAFIYRWLAPRFGKFRPWVIAGILPNLAMLLLMAFLPFAEIPYYNRLWAIFLVFRIYDMFSNYHKQVQNITNLVSPNSHERLKLMSYGDFIAGAFPAIVNAALPAVAMYTGGMNSLRTFQIVIPAFALAFAPFTLIMAFKVKERVILPPNEKPDINMFNGFREVLKNKYFWIFKFMNLFLDLDNGVVNIAQIIFIYSLRKDWILGFYTVFLNSAALPGQMFTPTLVKRFGKRAVFLAGRFATLIQLFVSYYAISKNNILLFFVASYAGYIVNSASVMARRAMIPDIWDYQQWMSGKRLEACSDIFNMVFSPFTTLITMTVPAVYAAIGFTSDWDIMFSEIYRNRVFQATIIMVIVSTALSILPFIFYDLTDEKHRNIIEDLKTRAGLAQAAEDTEESNAGIEAARK